MTVPYSKNKKFTVEDEHELFHNANRYEGIGDAAITFNETWDDNSVPERFVIKSIEYEEGLAHTVEYHHKDNITSSIVMLKGLNSLIDANILKPVSTTDE